MQTLSRLDHARQPALVALAAVAVLTLAGCDGAAVQANGTTGTASSSKRCAGYERTPFWCRGPANNGGTTGASGPWDAEQRANAAVIVDVGRDMGVPRRALVVALATAMQESSLRVDACCDHDSVGLFQQRPSQGWGSRAECYDPRTASRSFYTALSRVPGWSGMSVTRAAQAVQRSAYPDEYAKWTNHAEQLVG